MSEEDKIAEVVQEVILDGLDLRTLDDKEKHILMAMSGALKKHLANALVEKGFSSEFPEPTEKIKTVIKEVQKKIALVDCPFRKQGLCENYRKHKE